MMDRCYKKSYKAYKNYGNKGVFVCERWHTFNNFLEDLDKIKGFNLDLFLNGKICLDKDKIGNSKEYSLDKCCFISLEENNKYKPNQQKLIIGISPNNEIYEFYNQSQFAKDYGLRQSCIGDCLSGKCKTHKGWKFYFLKNK